MNSDQSPPHDPVSTSHSARRGWHGKFADAFRGLVSGARGQSSFYVHYAATALVVLAAVLLRVSRLEWSLLILCISVVLTAEYLNSAIEKLAKTLHPDFNPQIGEALDSASAGVLLASLGACLIGALVFVPALLRMAAAWR